MDDFDFDIEEHGTSSEADDFDFELFEPKKPEIPFFMPNEHSIRAMVACAFCKHYGHRSRGKCDISLDLRSPYTYIYCDHFDLHDRSMWIAKLKSHIVPGIGGWFDIRRDYIIGLPKSSLHKNAPLQYHGPPITCKTCGSKFSKRSEIR